MSDAFSTMEVDTGETHIFARVSGSGPPLLLLHGFPQTHLMWRDVAPTLARHFTVICADLRGYGQSGCPASSDDHAPYAKRAMAQDMMRLMASLGHDRFAVAGHDRGGRVAYRLALDHPDRITRLAVLDVVPTAMAWDRADARLALAFWPWSLLAQPEPLPERLIAGAPDAVIADAVSQWGSDSAAFPPEIIAAYTDALRDPAHIHAICEEYRAAATIDREHDAADQEAGRRIACPTLVLWSARGGLAHWYADDGGPLDLWRGWSQDVCGKPISAGHFFAEEAPDETATALRNFFRD
ncbi:alpha/beta fold hydrolase [Sphingomonas sp.]|uniref:alpha/beta fold hydrolase n=1 Tax=Sphingomonas sp. TaxID=28214 RepID=UPI003D6D541B